MTETDSNDKKPGRLNALFTPKETVVNRRYTRFVKSMRVILPLCAAGLIVLVMAWPEMGDKIEPVVSKDMLPDKTIAKNELIKPRFESTDDKNQPFTITADKAIQSQSNPNLVNLEKPMGDLTTTDGNWLAIEANEGTYEQNTEKLFLQGNVVLFHDAGYQLKTEEMRIDMKKHEAFSDQPVSLQGPEGELRAAGLKAFSDKGLLIFNGPAELKLTSSSLQLGEAMP